MFQPFLMILAWLCFLLNLWVILLTMLEFLIGVVLTLRFNMVAVVWGRPPRPPPCLSGLCAPLCLRNRGPPPPAAGSLALETPGLPSHAPNPLWTGDEVIWDNSAGPVDQWGLRSVQGKGVGWGMDGVLRGPTCLLPWFPRVRVHVDPPSWPWEYRAWRVGGHSLGVLGSFWGGLGVSFVPCLGLEC